MHARAAMNFSREYKRALPETKFSMELLYSFPTRGKMVHVAIMFTYIVVSIDSLQAQGGDGVRAQTIKGRGGGS